jgi:hypothetical protein
MENILAHDWFKSETSKIKLVMVMSAERDKAIDTGA